MESPKKEYALEEFTEISWKEHIRLRPHMYLGNEGVSGLFKGLIFDCIEICTTDEFFFEIEILSTNNFKLRISSNVDLSPFIDSFDKSKQDSYENYFPFVLKSISENFKLVSDNNSEVEIFFSFDTSIALDLDVDYYKLSENMFHVAILKRKCEIIIVDKRKKYLSQNYFHFPEGVLYLFEKEKKETLGRINFNLIYDTILEDNSYQIGIAYRTDWYPPQNIISYANNYSTCYGGSLVDGILDGLVLGCKRYVKEHNLKTFKIKRNKFRNGLILVASVSGKEFNYGGSFRETLEDKTVRNEIKRVISILVFEYLNSEKEIADNFLWRFDTEHISSGMY